MLPNTPGSMPGGGGAGHTIRRSSGRNSGTSSYRRSSHASSRSAPDSTDNSGGGSSGSNSLNFFRKLIGRRAPEYATTAAESPGTNLTSMGPEEETTVAPSAAGSHAPAPPEGEDGVIVRRGGGIAWLSRVLCCCTVQQRERFFRGLLGLSEHGQDDEDGLTHHHHHHHPKKTWYNQLWRVLIILCTLLLLFGGQIRTLATDARADTAFDAIFCTVFVIFLLEIIMRCDVEPNYFAFHLNCLDRQSRRQRQRGGGRGGGRSEESSSSSWGELPSFLFWCELCSTFALFHEISFIHQRNFREREIDITLDASGIPISGMDDVNESSPISYSEYALLFTIAKTARVARFIRSTTARKLSSRMNWYFFWNLVNPFWYARVLRNMCGRRSAETDASGAGGGVRRSGSENDLASEREGSDSGVGGAPKLVRSASWGGLALGTVALVQANARRKEEEERMNERGFKGMCRKVLRMCGLMRRSDEAWKRNLAATKIQRAWRSAKYHNHGASGDEHEGLADHSERDVAWRSSTVSNTMRAGLMASQHGNNNSNNRDGANSSNHKHGGARTHSRVTSQANKNNEDRRSESQVGSAMRELTGERVAIGILLALVLTVLFTYTERDATRPATMIVLHNQTANVAFSDRAIQAARDTSAPDLFEYMFANGTVEMYTPTDGESVDHLRDREKLRITVWRNDGDAMGTTNSTIGIFSNRDEARQQAIVSLLSTLFIILVWFFGVTAFVGPVMVLVVIPIERMVRLLGMLTDDPLGYQSTSRYKRFVAEADEITRNTRWTRDILNGMETSFLMSTILRIGSLMKVGFGSAGVEIIRKNLDNRSSQTSKNNLVLSEKGSTVSCIFLFCDIRQFTDATECLQEEVFVFTNRIAAVVHSICHAYGGSANKNIGDAFLLSWLLDEEEHNPSTSQQPRSGRFGGASNNNNRGSHDNFLAKHNQADKALLSVVKICMALHHDDYYIGTLSQTAREALLAKLSKRKGPAVQLGFGLHAGKAVQGAIGSQRKIDATYVSEAVERAEFLESSTKKYGVKMLMSDNFHRLLHPNNRRRCRKVDQIMLRNEDDEDDDDGSGEIMELLTFDMDIDALWKNVKTPGGGGSGSMMGKQSSNESVDSGSDRNIGGNNRKGNKNSARQLSGGKLKGRRLSVRVMSGGAAAAAAAAVAGLKEPVSEGEMSEGFMPSAGGGGLAAAASSASNADLTGENNNANEGSNNNSANNAANNSPPELVLPTRPILYNASVWVSEDMRRIRQLYSDGIFFQKFNAGLNSYYSRDWEHARQCFVTILERFEDGPSRYFLTQIENNNGKPPRNFQPYGSE